MKGITLIEVLVALAVAVVVISAVTGLGITSLNNVQFIKDQDLSTKYAQEGMDIVHSIRNSNYAGLRTYSGTYCLNGGQTTLGSPVSGCTTPNVVGRYIRSVVIVQDGCGVNLANITVSVAWIDAKCATGVYCHVSKLTSCLSTVSPVTAP